MSNVVSGKPGLGVRLLRIARSIGYIFIILALLPSYRYLGGTVTTFAERDFVVEDMTRQPYRSEFTLGLPPSPLVNWFREKSVVDLDGRLSVQETSGAGFHLLSWSMACLAAGAAVVSFTDRRLKAVGAADGVTVPKEPDSSR